jgi:glutathione S-transferase
MKVNDAYDELRLGIAMNPRIQDLILKATGAQTAIRLEIVQRLWSGYGEIVLVLEDLDAAGFPGRRTAADETRMRACLHWLAHFHATFIGEPPEGLWPTGTYWHLATRPDELEALNDAALKNAASAIDRALRVSPYQTWVHGDATIDNFCFSADGQRVAAVDFQYVGGGPGIKDVAYFIDSCLDGDTCERQESRLLDIYFQALKQALQRKQKAVDADAIEQDWRALYPVAWTDFHRFLKGWSPACWDPDSYSERLARQVIKQLQKTSRRDDAFVEK